VEGFDCATTWIDARVRRARELANIVELRVLIKGKEERLSSHSRGGGKGVVLRGLERCERARRGREEEEVKMVTALRERFNLFLFCLLPDRAWQHPLHG
jgi:hypothetical protein